MPKLFSFLHHIALMSIFWIQKVKLFMLYFQHRFHLHENLLHAIKKALYKEIPSSIKIENNSQTSLASKDDKNNKKNPKNCG